MRVLVDATAVPHDRGGVGRYVDALVGALDAAGTDLVVACQPQDGELLAALAPQARIAVAPAGTSRRATRMAWEQTGLAALVRSTRADLVHSPHYTLPLAAGRPVVVTLHDATFFTDPGVHTRVKGAFFRSWTRLALRRAERCIVPSSATRDELVRVAAGAVAGSGSRISGRIDVAYHGVDPAAFHVPSGAERARVAASLGLGSRGYVAFLGTLEPRKNLPELIRGFAAAVGGVPVGAADGGAQAPALVLAGGAGWGTSLDGLLAALPPSITVLRPGYLPLADLPGLLGGALVVAYPSLGEGFGLPVLEAMSCGAPVLTTRRLALPEVGGDAVAYTDVDATSISAALRALLADANRRAALSAAAVERAATFTWAASAQAHLASYERALGG